MFSILYHQIICLLNYNKRKNNYLTYKKPLQNPVYFKRKLWFITDDLKNNKKYNLKYYNL
jgi:hypothetical protein